MSPSFIILFSIPFFLLLIGIELLAAKAKGIKIYRFNDAIANLNIGIGQQAVTSFTKLILIGIYIYIFSNYAILAIPSTWWTWIICLIVFDFIYYWIHRWSHTVNFFWGAHVVHHSSEEFNFSVALRQSWIQSLISFIIFLPVPLLGFPPLIFFTAAAFHTLYQFWIHTETINKLPKWFEYLFNTPSNHRVHHGRNPKYIDKNHAGFLMVWDRIFGTFEPEDEKVVYGITTPLNSWNPTWANMHYYVEMAEKTSEMKKWKHKLYMLFAKPGWLPEELGGFQSPPEIEKGEVKKFNANTSFILNLYVLVQFIGILVGICAFLYNFNSLSWFYRVAFFGIIILSTMICGAVMENKRWVYAAEYIRLALLVLCFDSFYFLWHINWFEVAFSVSIGLFIFFSTWFTLSWIISKPKERRALNND